jgi:acetyltransferase-like isoleucine patch superfamily enzyme
MTNAGPHDWCSLPVPGNVRIGEGSWVHSSFAFVHYRSVRPVGLRVGRSTGIYIGTLFDIGPDGEVEVGDFCTLAGAVIATNDRVVIGDYALISFQVVIADTFAAVPPGSRQTPSRHSSGGPISIERDVWVGARAVLLGGARLGEGSIVGAATVVDFDVPPHAVVAGNPARIVAWADQRSGNGPRTLRSRRAR